MVLLRAYMYIYKQLVVGRAVYTLRRLMCSYFASSRLSFASHSLVKRRFHA